MWTKEFPGFEGYYWIRYPANRSIDPEIVFATPDDNGRLMVLEFDVEEASRIEDYDGQVEWCRVSNLPPN
jgi:hypothetical protein